jgi:hypothetical protein
MTDPTARQRLLDAMRNRTCFCGADSCHNAEDYVDDYAHQLAETIRNRDYDPGAVEPVHLTVQADADLIDPEAQR